MLLQEEAEEAGDEIADNAVCCLPCKMLLNGPSQYQDHLRTRRHRKKLRKQRKQQQEAQTPLTCNATQPRAWEGQAVPAHRAPGITHDT